MGASMCVLGVGAHPDDLEIACGGTLAKCRRRGDEVVMCHATAGEKGTSCLPPPEAVRVRTAEAGKAAAIIGARAVGLGLPDTQVFDNEPARMAMVDLIRDVGPDIIITHSPRDFHADHTTVSKLVCAASFLAWAPYLGTESGEEFTGYKVPAVYFMDTFAGIDFEPGEYVDITATMAAKTDMLRVHRSQHAFFKEDQKSFDILDFVDTVARFRGIQAGTKYAEAFCEHGVWPRAGVKRLLP